MLTVDFDLLGLQRGDLVLDMGAGAGRHSFECFRRGAQVISLDYGFDELPPVRKLMWAMQDAGEAPLGSLGACVNGDALCLPFPDHTFDRIICSEVFEHIPDDRGAMAELHRVLRPDGVLAATVPSWMPEKVCWQLSAEYHAPLAAGGHVRIYTESMLVDRLVEAGFRPEASHRAHALHSPYWWLKCLVGPTNDTHPLVQAYHKVLVWDIASSPALTRTAERLLNPVLGKSVVVYSRRTIGGGTGTGTGTVAGQPASRAATPSAATHRNGTGADEDREDTERVTV